MILVKFSHSNRNIDMGGTEARPIVAHFAFDTSRDCQIIGWGVRRIRNCRDQPAEVVSIGDAPEVVFHDVHRNAVGAFPPVLGAAVNSLPVTAILYSLFKGHRRIFYTRQSRSTHSTRALSHNTKLKKLRSAKQYLDKLPNTGC